MALALYPIRLRYEGGFDEGELYLYTVPGPPGFFAGGVVLGEANYGGFSPESRRMAMRGGRRSSRRALEMLLWRGSIAVDKQERERRGEGGEVGVYI